MGDATYEVKRSILGGYAVYYPCPRCGEEVKSPLSDAGKRDKCPTCQMELRVPGDRELEQQREYERQKAAADAKQKQLARDAKEKARAEREEQERLLANREAEALEERRRERAQPRPNRGGTSITVVIVVSLLTAVSVYLSVVLPLQRKVRRAEIEVGEIKGALESLASTVNRNAERQLSTAEGLASLARTVNRNADALDSLKDTVNYNARISNLNNLRR